MASGSPGIKQCANICGNAVFALWKVIAFHLLPYCPPLATLLGRCNRLHHKLQTGYGRTRVQTGYAGGTYPGTDPKRTPLSRVQLYPGTKPGNGLYSGVFRASVSTSFSGTILLRAESTSFTSMGSQVRVLLRPLEVESP